MNGPPISIQRLLCSIPFKRTRGSRTCCLQKFRFFHVNFGFVNEVDDPGKTEENKNGVNGKSGDDVKADPNPQESADDQIKGEPENAETPTDIKIKRKGRNKKSGSRLSKFCFTKL